MFILSFSICLKPFKVWYEGLLFKLRQNGIYGKLLLLLKGYLPNRKQRVIINGSESEWGKIESGVPQGSLLEPLLFLIYTSDLDKDIKSHINLCSLPLKNRTSQDSI